MLQNFLCNPSLSFRSPVLSHHPFQEQHLMNITAGVVFTPEGIAYIFETCLFCLTRGSIESCDRLDIVMFSLL